VDDASRFDTKDELTSVMDRGAHGIDFAVGTGRGRSKYDL